MEELSVAHLYHLQTAITSNKEEGIMLCQYIITTKFEIHIVTDQVFSSFIYGATVNQREKKQGSLTYVVESDI